MTPSHLCHFPISESPFVHNVYIFSNQDLAATYVARNSKKYLLSYHNRPMSRSNV